MPQINPDSYGWIGNDGKLASGNPMTNSSVFDRFPDLPRDPADKADLSPYLADLATTFPLLFHMLATDTGDFAHRAAVLRLVENGEPLAKAAIAYKLPLCLRRVPPEACRGRLGWFGWSKNASAALANHVPRDPRNAE
ncbi:MAG: hypothetical protein JSS20_11135, partial [Proteobacteria bacterium]|nr:hypothetical protein [Pseudomonadota bacterium]